ncbi:EthD domain-containing protein [Pseudomonas saliphila]|uniref:EthD domain-containing protein n=1 Tax=Pseudomonas saliphila TaxID=2586906 RepID=UPI00123BA0AD|nr:EthD domain-containing protein [Pseudomonas saliphila]
MATVTTIALLSKKNGMPDALFTKYWRDVHGMLATRIPGFSSYVQFHLQAPLKLRPSDHGAPETDLQGIAIVDFVSENERAGLASSEVAGMIRQDETNLFQSSLLYNLQSGADNLWLGHLPNAQQEEKHYFLLLQRCSGSDPSSLMEALRLKVIPALCGDQDIIRLRLFPLRISDAAHWETPGVNNQPSDHNNFDVVLQVTGVGDRIPESIGQSLEELPLAPGRLQLYPVNAAYPMVQDGRPTHLGLRGLDVLQTIEAVGAANQYENRLLELLYGVSTDSKPKPRC